jgi:hypothetical protein
VNKSLKNVAESRYFGTTLTNQNLINEESKSRLNLNNACLSSHLKTKSIKIKKHKTKILPILQRWLEHRLIAFENRMLMKICIFTKERGSNMGRKNVYNKELHNL